jgi:Zn-dependent peptidase ImmA (M78 family)
MNIPESLDILGTTFLVKQESITTGEAGLTQCWKRQITIDSDLDYDAKVETFYHELAHAVLGMTGVEQALDEKQNEAVAQALGFALAQIVSDNTLPKYEEEVR